MKNYFKKGIHFLRDFSIYFKKGWQASLFGLYAKSFIHSLFPHINHFRHSLYLRGIEQHHIHDEKLKKLRITTKGLYSLFPRDERFSFSILLPIVNPKIEFFKTALESISSQSATAWEILVGFVQMPSKEVKELLAAFKERHTNVKIFEFDSAQHEIDVINQLADNATGNFLFVMGDEDWIRPDLFYRYEQTLRMFNHSENVIMYCNHNKLSDRNFFIPLSEYHQPTKLQFPYFFKQFEEKGLLVSRFLWKKVQGLDATSVGAEYDDLLLKLDLAGAKFQHVPLSLYSKRASVNQRKKFQTAFLRALEKYTKAKQLRWNWSSGYAIDSAKAAPEILSYPIQVIIPYKDQKEMTLRCIKHILKQQDVLVKITALDNGSEDVSIAEEIRSMGGEVITVQEPFNYSRLNNIAVKETKTAQDCPVILFLNNDVELDSHALSEMARWVHQPQIGMVGCRLHYPDGRLQHGGIYINEQDGIPGMIYWEHAEKFRCFNALDHSKALSLCDAVTAACAMTRRQIFLDVGGFDEIWYPIGFSDTHLATKLAAKGMYCLYTPYAFGVHYESVTRRESIEDYENSWWLHSLFWKPHEISKSNEIRFRTKITK